MNKNKVAVVLLASAIFAAVQSAKADPASETAAVASAEKWLAVIDSGRYTAGYDNAASILKTAVKRDEFANKLKASRGMFGKVKSRTLRRKTYATSLPGAPDGEYVVIQFDTAFDKKQSAVETITPTKEKGVWKVSGYYIK